MYKKNLLSVFVLLVAMLAGTVSAADFDFTNVEVNDIPAGVGSIFVERESTVLVEVFVEGLGDSDRARVKAWIGGYEHGSVRDETDIFRVETGVIYKKSLRLNIPEDLDPDQDYTLHVEIFDDTDSVEEEFDLRVKGVRHRVQFVDVFFRPGSSVEAGENLFTTVRLENLGQKKEEDIKVTVSIPALGIWQSTFIDELVTVENTNDDGEETSESTDEVVLRIPANAKTGVYDVRVDVEFNRGRSTFGTTRTVNVHGEDPVDASGSTVNVDKHLVELVPGKRSNLMVTVESAEDASYKVEVDGTELFASATVAPSVMTVREGKSGVFTITLNTLNDAETGTSNFVVRVVSGNEIVEEFVLTADVDGKETNVREGLVIGFIVLVVVLIILGLIIAFQRMRPEESEDGASYY